MEFFNWFIVQMETGEYRKLILYISTILIFLLPTSIGLLILDFSLFVQTSFLNLLLLVVMLNTVLFLIVFSFSFEHFNFFKIQTYEYFSDQLVKSHLEINKQIKKYESLKEESLMIGISLKEELERNVLEKIDEAKETLLKHEETLFSNSIPESIIYKSAFIMSHLIIYMIVFLFIFNWLAFPDFSITSENVLIVFYASIAFTRVAIVVRGLIYNTKYKIKLKLVPNCLAAAFFVLYAIHLAVQ